MIENNIALLEQYEHVLLYGENEGIKEDIKNKIKEKNKDSKPKKNINTSMRTCCISFSRQRPPLPPRCGEHQSFGNDGSGNNDSTNLLDHLILHPHRTSLKAPPRSHQRQC